MMANGTLFGMIATIKPIARERLTLVEPRYQSIQQLPVGQVSTIVEIYAGETPHYLVEFADSQGSEYAMAVLLSSEFLAIQYELSLAS